MGGSKSSNSTQNTTQNIDNRLTTESGNIFGLSVDENAITNNEGTIIVNDTAAIQQTLDVITKLGNDTLNTAKSLADGSNAIADNVRSSQEQFVETASGQKLVTNGVFVLGGLAATYILIKTFKKK